MLRNCSQAKVLLLTVKLLQVESNQKPFGKNKEMIIHTKISDHYFTTKSGLKNMSGKQNALNRNKICSVQLCLIQSCKLI